MNIFIARPRCVFRLLFFLLLSIWQSVVFGVGFLLYIFFQRMFKIKKIFFVPLCFLPPLLLGVVMPISFSSLGNVINDGFWLNVQFWKLIFDALVYGINFSAKISGIGSGFLIIWKSGFLILFSLPISALLSLIDLIPDGSHPKTLKNSNPN